MDGGQVNEGHAIGEGGRRLFGQGAADGDGQPRLARAARPGQGDEARPRQLEQIGHGGDVVGAADEAGEGSGQQADGWRVAGGGWRGGERGR